MSGGRDWTRKDERLLLELVGRGVKHLVAARLLRRTPAAVRMKLWNLRGRPSPATPRRRPGELGRKVRWHHARGLNDVAIAETLGLHPNTVRECRLRLGLPSLVDHSEAQRIRWAYWRRRREWQSRTEASP